jgi:hypothetical protein
VGIPLSLHASVTVTQDACGLVAVAGTVWLLCHAHKLDVVRLLGVALVLIVVGSPTVWPWYLLWGLVILAATRVQRSKVLAAAVGLAMLVVGSGGSPMLGGDAYLVTAPVVVAACLWLIWKRHWWAVVADHAV